MFGKFKEKANGAYKAAKDAVDSSKEAASEAVDAARKKADRLRVREADITLTEEQLRAILLGGSVTVDGITVTKGD